MITHPGADGRRQPPKRCPVSDPGSDPGMRDPDRNGSGMMIMKESMTMKHMKHWMTVLAALVLALMMTVGAFRRSRRETRRQAQAEEQGNHFFHRVSSSYIPPNVSF